MLNLQAEQVPTPDDILQLEVVELLAVLFNVEQRLAARGQPHPNNIRAQIVRAMKAYVALGGAHDRARARDADGDDDGDADGDDDGDYGDDDGDDGQTAATMAMTATAMVMALGAPSRAMDENGTRRERTPTAIECRLG